MSDDEGIEASLNITVKRKGKQKSGFEVELRDDGHYYISAVPKGHNKVKVGDRVLEINGTKKDEFGDETNANSLFDTFKLEVIPNDESEEESSEEEEEEDEEAGETAAATAASRAASASDEGYNDNSQQYNDRVYGDDADDDENYDEEEMDVDEDGDDDNDGDAGIRVTNAGDDDDDDGIRVSDDGIRVSDEGDTARSKGSKKPRGGPKSDNNKRSSTAGDDGDGIRVNDGSDGIRVDDGGDGIRVEPEQDKSKNNAPVEPPVPPKPKTRPTAKYVPNDRFMVTVTKQDGSDDCGLELVEYRDDFYISKVYSDGPFNTTAVDIGDKILSINGKKSRDIDSVAYAMEIMEFKDKITLFVMRLDPRDKGYKWVIENY